MHIQVVTFRLKDMSEEQYRALVAEVAPAFSAAPDLIAKVWLTDPATGTYGGVYTWADRAAFEAYTRSELFQAIANNPGLTDLISRDYAVLEAPTAITRGLVAAAA
jgi:quinol monooxygenase YgiN